VTSPCLSGERKTSFLAALKPKFIKMKKKFLFSLILCLVFSQNLISQEKSDSGKKTKSSKEEVDEKEKENKVVRWNFGVNIGVYFANKYPANFYNGSPSNENNVNYVLSNKYWNDEIKQTLDAGYKVAVSQNGYPTDMHYNFVMSGGLFIRYNLNKNWGVCLDVNYTQLKAEDYLMLDVDTITYLTYRQYVLEPIRGVEQRVHLDLLLQRNFWLKTKIYFFVQGGLNLNYTRVMKSAFYVEGNEYNMVNIYNSSYMPGAYQQEYQVIQGGVGYGFALGGGMGFPLITQLGIEPGGFINFNNVNLPGYPDFKLSFGFNVRFLFGNILPREDED
jgi:hypothetical protein